MNVTHVGVVLHTGVDDTMMEESNFSDGFLDDMMDACGSVMSFDPLDPNQDMEDMMNPCLEVVLGDNPIGDLYRRIYHNLDEFEECIKTLEEAVPVCLYTIEVPGEESVAVPGSLFKKSACLIVQLLSGLDEICETELAGLDSCLPITASGNDCDQVITECANQGVFSVQGPPFNLITGTELPDSCLRVYEEQGLTTKVPERYTAFSTVCNGGTTVASTSMAVQAPEASPKHVSTSSTTASASGTTSGSSNGPICRAVSYPRCGWLCGGYFDQEASSCRQPRL